MSKDSAERSNIVWFLKNPLNIIGIILCIFLIPILVINCILIVKSFVNPDSVPSINGYSPLIVLTESMEPDIKSGDLIIVKEIDKEDIEVGLVISFFDPESKSNSVVTHKIEERVVEDGTVFYRTKGINNNIADKALVPEDNVIGVYTGTRFAGLGSIVIFAQSTWGLVICVLIIVAIFALFFISHYVSSVKRRKEETSEQDAAINEARAEVERLKQRLAEVEDLEKKEESETDN